MIAAVEVVGKCILLILIGISVALLSRDSASGRFIERIGASFAHHYPVRYFSFSDLRVDLSSAICCDYRRDSARFCEAWEVGGGNRSSRDGMRNE
jgi:hypothetical protein